MQTKSGTVLYITVILMAVAIIIGCIYFGQETKQQIDSTSQTKHDDTITKETKTIDIESGKDGDANQAIKPVSLGNFKLTAYCDCSLCCGKWSDNRPNGIVYGSIGEELKEDYSIAVDPDVIPYRTEVIINGHTYKAQDCGGAIKGNRIDVYFENHIDALNFGVQYAEVFVAI